MHRAILTALFAVLLFTFQPLTAAHAGRLPRPDLPDAQTLIEACWRIATASREAPDLATQRAGFDKTAGCLEYTIMRLLDELHFGDFDLSRSGAREELAKLRDASRRIYRAIYRDSLQCAQPCTYSVANRYLAAHIANLEKIIRTMIWKAAVHTDQIDSIKRSSRPFVDAWVALSIDDPGIPNPKAIVDACWKISEADRAGNNSQIREGHLKTVLCLEEAVGKLYDVLPYRSSSLTKEQLRADLFTIRFALGRFYWLIYNESGYCKNFCGTIWFSAHLPPISAELITIINTLVLQNIPRQSDNRSP